ncbi:TniQ family protein, partial [Tabrizicola sp.]|uniref:TniQ family protein n=1 Tax=Tabrizicola sp. TaxID=2005166 RepID=UPI0035B14EB7
MILLPHFPFDACETSTSFLRRLSLFHTGQGAERLLADLSIDGNAFLSGDAEALSILARASEIDVSALQWGTISRFARHRKCRGERWSREFVLPEGARFCPQCLLDDGADTVEWAGMGRLVWRLRPVLTCNVHCRRLVTLPDKSARWEINHRYPSGKELRELADQQAEQTPTVLENLIHDRILGQETHEGSWLRLQTIEQVTEACEMIGASVEHGPIFDVAAMSPAAWRAAGA